MDLIDIHSSIKTKLNGFLTNHKVPNIIFYGSNGSGKKTILKDFVCKLYGIDNCSYTSEVYEQYIKVVNCAYGKGIKFIRDELKFFAKTKVDDRSGEIFKSVILLHAEQLTIDAQSALRRCIELFTHDTRFFMVVNDKTKLIKPIISRFCCIYVPPPFIDEHYINLNSLKNVKLPIVYTNKKTNIINKVFKLLDTNNTGIDYFKHAEDFVEKGLSGLDVIDYIKTHLEDNKSKYELLIFLDNIRLEIKNEVLLIQMMLNIYFMRNNESIENINIL